MSTDTGDVTLTRWVIRGLDGAWLAELSARSMDHAAFIASHMFHVRFRVVNPREKGNG